MDDLANYKQTKVIPKIFHIITFIDISYNISFDNLIYN